LILPAWSRWEIKSSTFTTGAASVRRILDGLTAQNAATAAPQTTGTAAGGIGMPATFVLLFWIVNKDKVFFKL